MPFLPFFAAKNLSERTLVEYSPWDFIIPDEDNWPKKLTKPKRRQALLMPDALWNCYTSIRGFAPNLVISKTNPPAGIRGLVVDYDMVSDIDTVCKYLEQIPENVRPNFVEISLSNKIRLVWNFEREILVPSMDFCSELLEEFFKQIGIPSLLAGYDPVGSLKPTERWTNGGKWYGIKDTPLPWDYCFGVVCKVSKKSKLFDQSQIPLEKIAEEVQTRYPNKWNGDFKLDALGVRFWDETADNPTGCQIKPDGMLCFTGSTPFVKWEAIFGKQWCETQKVLNLGQAGENFYFDGNVYWECSSARWVNVKRPDIILRLKNRGLSDHCAKGDTQSDVERVLNHIQLVNRVEGAAPFVNYRPGLLELNGYRFLNVANLNTVQPIPGPSGTPSQDFPFISAFIKGLFARPELGPLDHFLTWLKFGHTAYLNYERHIGQAVFICGPKNNGKTLLIDKICAPMLGNRTADPMDFLTGATNFNDELFHAGLLAINDKDAPRNDGERARMLMQLKSFVVNPSHTYHPKFCNRVTIHWTGRVMVSLNDDPASVGVLPEISTNTEDKMSFFASQRYSGTWKSQRETETTVAAELPYFSDWLVNVYQPPDSVLSNEYRGGVKSYFDPVILELSRSQLYSYNLEELLRAWWRISERSEMTWQGSPTDLMTELNSWEPLKGVAKEWTQPKVSKALTALARQNTGSVKIVEGSVREFVIDRNKL